jgi:hypothetical protein
MVLAKIAQRARLGEGEFNASSGVQAQIRRDFAFSQNSRWARRDFRPTGKP